MDLYYPNEKEANEPARQYGRQNHVHVRWNPRCAWFECRCDAHWYIEIDRDAGVSRVVNQKLFPICQFAQWSLCYE